MKISKRKRTCLAAGAILAVLGAGAVAQAQDATGTDASAPTLSLAELERRVQALGVTLTEMEVEGLLLEVEGLDAEGREVDLVLDRRSGEVLSRKLDR